MKFLFWKNTKIHIIFLGIFFLSVHANATVWVEVDDASKLLWQMEAGGTVWFRNLNEFNSQHAGCCYAYYLDTTTDGGKSVWSAILVKMAAKEKITLGFPVGSNENKQALTYIGRHKH